MAVVAAFGLMLALVPAAVLDLVAGDRWEIDLLRFSGLFVAGMALLRPRTIRNADAAARRLPAWLLGVWLCGGGYFLWGRPLFLIIGFSLLVGMTLDSAVEQAHLASENYLRRLQRPEDHPA
jgi:hypothetical protein